MKMHFDPTRPYSIANPTRFWHPPSVEAFHLPSPVIEPARGGDFVGDTTKGGSVNCFVLTCCPHGNGTHTEGVGHLVHERVAVLDCHDGRLLSARLVSVEPVRFGQTSDGYDGNHDDSDWVVEAKSIQERLGDASQLEAIVLRVSLPDGLAEGGRFSGQNAPYLTAEAMDRIGQNLSRSGHLLTNLPSIDREQCGGHTPNHRILWGLSSTSRRYADATYSERTLTELIRTDFGLDDGEYVLDLQIAPFDTDAVPSRPILYPRT